MSEENDERGRDNAIADNSVMMKKSKKFIKFKDFIIKLPNSMGLTGHKSVTNTTNIINNNDLISFVEPRPKGDEAAVIKPEDNFENESFGYNPFGMNQHVHPNQQLRDKGYSIYVVDDEHEIHKFDIDTYEWTIISTTKD